MPGFSQAPLSAPFAFGDFYWYPFTIIKHHYEHNSLFEFCKFSSKSLNLQVVLEVLSFSTLRKGIQYISTDKPFETDNQRNFVF